MATTAEHLREPDMLRTYLRALARTGGTTQQMASGRQRRVCAHCGQRAVFTLEAEGTWYRCGECGRYA